MIELLVGRVNRFDDLRDLIDTHRKSLGITLLALDDLAGLQGGYSSKLACGIKNYGNMSLPSVLGALGLELWVVRAASGHGRSNLITNTYVENYKNARKKIARLGAQAANEKRTAEQRRLLARKAAVARWEKAKKKNKQSRLTTNKDQLVLF